MSVWAFSDYLLLEKLHIYEHPGDHAGPWETSHLLATCPECVDMSLASKEYQYGIMGPLDPATATAEFGNEIYDRAAELAAEKVRYRLAHPDEFQGHGMLLDE